MIKSGYTLFLFALLIANSSLISQKIILPYKDRMPIEEYNELSQAESEANNENNSIVMAEKFMALGNKSTRLSEDLGMAYYEVAMEAAIEGGSDSVIAKINFASSIPYINTSQFEVAESRINEALQYWQETRDTFRIAEGFILISYLERVKGSNYLAIRNLHKAKDLQKAKLPFSEMHGIISRLIINYNQLKDYESAILIGEEYLDSSRHLEPKPRGFYNILRNTGEMKLRVGDIEGAKVYIDEALPVWMKARIPKFMVSSYSLLHDLSIEEGDLLQAKTYADSSLYFALQYKLPLTVSDAHLRVYHILKKLEQTEDLDFHINEALAKAIESEHNTTMINAARAASTYRSDKGEYAEAYRLLFLADSIRQEIYSEETINNIKNFEKQTLREESQQKVDLLESKNELTNLRLSASRKRGIIFGFGLLSFAVFSFWLFHLYKRIQSQNSVISKALNEKETLLKEIHHRVKNNLQFISSLLRLQTGHVKDEAALDVLHEGQDRVQSMALIHQNLYQEDNLTGVDMRVYFNKLIQGLFSSYNIHNDRIQLELDIADINLDVDTVVPLGLIVNELISNSLKYAFPEDRSGHIRVRLDREDKTLLLSVADDGVGISSAGEEKMNSSFGYKLINAFTQQLDADMLVDGSDGTRVEFRINSFELAS